MWNDYKKCSLEIHRKLSANDFSEITLIISALKARSPECPSIPKSDHSELGYATMANGSTLEMSGQFFSG